MKIKSLAILISLTISGCTATQITSKQEAQAVNSPTPVVMADKAVGAMNSGEITLEQIMADPDWMGRSPESWYWGDDSQSIFYKQKREGSKVRDLFRTSIAGGNGNLVELSQLHQFADANAVKNKDKTLEAYSFEGDIYLKNLLSGDVKQITRSSAIEMYPMFLLDGRLAYQEGNTFWLYDPKAGVTIELATLVEADAPKGVTEPDSYLAKEQHKLIQYIAKKHQDAKDKEQSKAALKSQNTMVSESKYYFGNGNKIANSSLSPSGDKLIVSITKAGKRDEADIMPNYVSSDGEIKAQPARKRVADNRQYSEELFVIDLKSGEKKPLSFVNLPGYNDDVLADVRRENYAQEGKKYENNRLPRNIALMAAYYNIVWNPQGDQVALLLEAWDNKDRWITTVDFAEAKLITQHRYSDKAWVNYSFNEYGWINNNTLFYLSEESGYAQLYQKPLNGSQQALTSGQFVVSDLNLSADAKHIYYKANKKHPGIYEIYRVNVENGNSEALTDLGGMNDYALSPDESKLLIEHSKVTMPPELFVLPVGNASAKASRITHTVSDKFLSLPWTAPSVVAVPSSHGNVPIYSKVYLPKDFDTNSEKRRAVMFSHGAGYLQNSHLGWSGYFREFMFHSMLAQKGYVVMDMDYRASKGYGRDWRTAIYRHMGKPEVEDLRDGVNWMVENANVDRNRIGTYGGSYGGFLTLMSLFTAPDLFQSGAALRLVSDWAYYNHGYTSNILNTPEDDAIAYERSSPIYFAEGLQKPLLINAPMVDDNVFFQDTVRLVQRLIELEKENFETAIFPVEPHGFTEPSSWLDEYRRIFKLFENTL